MGIVFGRRRLEQVESGFYSKEDVKALARAVRAMERLANEGVLETGAGKEVRRLFTPEQIINALEEGLK